MESDLSQDEDWRGLTYPFLEDHTIHDDMLISNEKYQITIAMYSVDNQLKHIETDSTRDVFFNMTFSPEYSNFTRDDDYTFYEKLLKIKWRIRYLNEMICDITLWKLHSYKPFGLSHPLMYLDSFTSMVDNIKRGYEEWIQKWYIIRFDVIGRAQRKRINEFASLINKKFLRNKTYGVQMQIKPITFKIMLYLFDFHPDNQNSSYYRKNSLPEFRSSKRKLTFISEKEE